MPKPYKPDKADHDERHKHHKGKVLPWPVGSEPVFNPQVLVTRQCVICGIPFRRSEAICNHCGNCQACGGISLDRFGNACIQCGNHVDQPRFDSIGLIINIGA